MGSREAPAGAVLSAVLVALAVSAPRAHAWEELRTFDQAEQRDATGKITVEASIIHVVSCSGAGETGGEVYVYEYMNRPGYRAIVPPDWAHPLGGKDFGTFDEAALAGCGGGVTRGSDYRGCFLDTDDRDLGAYSVSTETNTAASCTETCAALGYAYAAVQYSSWCFCDNDYGKHGAATNCGMPCSGDSTQICGGSWANDVYATGR